MNIQKVKLNILKENPKNPRRIGATEVDKLCKSIQELPKMLEIRPLVINDDNTVLGGNARLRALRKLGYTEVPVIYASELNEEEKKKFIIADNSSFGSWDFEVLQTDFSEFNLGDFNIEKEEEEENYTEEKLKEKNIKIEPFNKTHILLSIDTENILYFTDILESLKNDKRIEFLQSSN